MSILTVMPHVHPLTLRFPDAWERKFYDEYFRASLPIIRFAAFGSALTWVIYLGWATLAGSAVLAPFSPVLLTIGPLSSLAIAALSFWRHFKPIMQPVIGAWYLYTFGAGGI